LKSHQEYQVSPTLTSLVNDEDGEPIESFSSLPMLVKSYSVQSSSGSDGLDSTVDHVSPDLLRPLSPYSTPISLDLLVL